MPKEYKQIKKISENRRAHAPYNFVPLNNRIMPCEKDVDGEPLYADRYHIDGKRLSGFIKLEIECLTPLYIRDTLTFAEYIEQKQIDKEKYEKTNNYGERRFDAIKSSFFSPTDSPRIPGSSIRGMIRTLFEIITFSKFNNFDDQIYSFRNVAVPDSLQSYYRERMKYSGTSCKTTGNAQEKINAGYIERREGEYIITPAKEIGSEQFNRHDDFPGVANFDFTNIRNESIRRSGEKVNRNQESESYLINLPNEDIDPLVLSSDDIASYLTNYQKNFKETTNLLAKADELAGRENRRERMVPCFYIIENKNSKPSIIIGYTKLFRIPYLNSTKTLIQRGQIDLGDDEFDMTEHLFGTVDDDDKEKQIAGRLCFHDATITNPNMEQLFLDEKSPQILASPKPTTFQHYLVQDKEDKNDLKHYDSDTTIRGFKMYWHKKNPVWYQNDQTQIEDHKSQYTRIKPINEGAKFQGRIDFTNLSHIELGALLSTLALKSNRIHKIGMAKPLGLGSIKMRPKLFISDKDSRYFDLKSEWENTESVQSIERYLSDYKNYLCDFLGEPKTQTSIWKIERLAYLGRMLTNMCFDDNEWLSKTRYMKIGNDTNDNVSECNDRRILPNTPGTTVETASSSEYNDRRILPAPEKV